MTPSPYDSDDWTRASRFDFSLREALANLRSRRHWTRPLAGVVGVASLSAAVVAGTGLGGGRAVTAVASVPWTSRGGLSFVAGLAVAGAVWSVYATVDDGEADGSRLPPPTEVSVDESSVVGADFDYSLDRSIDSSPEWWQGVGVREEVQSLAITVLHAEGGYDVDEAIRVLETGTWTDDPRAATYLAVDSHLSTRTAVRDWIRGDPERRRVEATLRELARIADVEGESADFDRRQSGPRVSDLRHPDVEGGDDE